MRLKALFIAGGAVLAIAAAVCLRFVWFGDNPSLDIAFRHLWQGGDNNAAYAVALLRDALRKEPGSAYRWCDLGEAFMETGQQEKARSCFIRAAALGPNSPPILIRVANFYFRVGENEEALKYTSGILRQIDQYDEVIFGSYTRFSSVAEVLKHGIPGGRRAARAYLRYLMRRKNVAAAEDVWNQMVSHSFADDQLAGEYIGCLMQNRRYETAAEAWLSHMGNRAAGYRRSNYVFNGGFEAASTGARLDWGVQPAAGVEVETDGNGTHSGASSLRIRFFGKENIRYGHISQTVIVRPGSYRFEAYVRTSGISTDKGIAFRIFDPDHAAKLDVETDQAAGSTEWRPVRRALVVGPATRLLVIQVVRHRSMKFDNKIAGTVWIDDISLRPSGEGS